jgi:acetylornithine deacetylase/succinyl-diaminopimelate desuccinylase-like protein
MRDWVRLKPDTTPGRVASGSSRTCLTFILCATVAHAQFDLRTAIQRWIDGHQQAVVAELTALLAIPNIAADRASIRRNAAHLEAMLARRGFAAEILETAGNPLVYGDLTVKRGARTVLFYAHYDGQPVDLKAWKQSSPFMPVMRTARVDRGGREIPDVARATKLDPEWRLYARSASDDKAPIVALCAALDALKDAGEAPAVNVRIVLDGEEEAGSPSLVAAIARYRDKLRADLMVILDGPEHPTGRPTIAYGARGIARLDLTVFGPRTGVHSGNYGNWVPNPAQRLATLLASMKDDEGRVLVKGFYDAVAPLSREEQAMLDAVPEDPAEMLRSFGIAAPEKAFPRLQAALQAPTLNVRGLTSAFVGANARTIIPDSATAAIDIRLVKETRGADLIARVRDHVRAQGYHIVEGMPNDETRATHPRIARIVEGGDITEAFRTSSSDPLARAVVATLHRTYGQPPVQLRTLGGTVPIAPFIEALGMPAVVVPTVNFDNNQHEENENLRMGTFFDAIVTIAALLRM